MRNRRVLGISLGTRKIGIAIVEEYSIYYSQMKSFTDSWSQQKLMTILAVIESYITKYGVLSIALKIPPKYSHSFAIAQLLTGIDTLAKSKKIFLHTFTLLMLKNGWAPLDQHPNKKELMDTILEKYNLMHLYKREIKNKTKHYEKIFEAVGVADIVLRMNN